MESVRERPLFFPPGQGQASQGVVFNSSLCRARLFLVPGPRTERKGRRRTRLGRQGSHTSTGASWTRLDCSRLDCILSTLGRHPGCYDGDQMDNDALLDDDVVGRTARQSPTTTQELVRKVKNLQQEEQVPHMHYIYHRCRVWFCTCSSFFFVFLVVIVVVVVVVALTCSVIPGVSTATESPFPPIGAVPPLPPLPPPLPATEAAAAAAAATELVDRKLCRLCCDRPLPPTPPPRPLKIPANPSPPPPLPSPPASPRRNGISLRLAADDDR